MDNFDEKIRSLSRSVLERCRALNWKVATAESCTGGLIVGAMTEIAGSSDVVDRGFITYSNEAKIEMLDVPVDTLVAHGAVSEQTARAMALGALANAKATIAVAVTGIAGPGGGSAEKPVGLVHFAVATPESIIAEHRIIEGDRGTIRYQTVLHALTLMLTHIEKTI